jgi:single-stranded DNA-binding protein
MVRRAKEERMNRVLLTGRLTRDPEMRSLANNKTVTQFRLATNENRGGQEKPEFHTVITWDTAFLRLIWPGPGSWPPAGA